MALFQTTDLMWKGMLFIVHVTISPFDGMAQPVLGLANAPKETVLPWKTKNTHKPSLIKYPIQIVFLPKLN